MEFKPDNPSIAFCAFRELLVLLFGCAISSGLSMFLANGRQGINQMPANPLLALFVPIIFCLIRASLAKSPRPDTSVRRRTAYQVILAMALVLLLLFEVGIGLIVGTPGVTAVAWACVISIGLMYIVVFCVAMRIGFPPAKRNDTRLELEQEEPVWWQRPAQRTDRN